MNVDFASIRRDAERLAEEKLDAFADRVVAWVKSRTPEDTGDLVNAIGKTEQVWSGTKLHQSVRDMELLPYTVFVEYGVMGKTYNYHKPKGSVFYVGVGAGMFRKTYADLKDKFNK